MICFKKFYLKQGHNFYWLILSFPVSMDSILEIKIKSDVRNTLNFDLQKPLQRKMEDTYLSLQVCLEGEISKDTILNSLSRGKRASGDMIPWTISQQYNDSEFGSLSGGRIVRIATHPDFQKVCKRVCLRCK